MTYPLKFRQHLLKVREEEGLTYAETARCFHIGLSSLMRWVEKPDAVKKRHRQSRIDREELTKDVELYPDDYQYERARRFGMRTRGMCDALRRLGISRKKKLQHPKADEQARKIFAEKIKQYQAADKPIIYIDESGFAVDMPRCHGYCLTGQRCYGKQD
ncbi:MAG: IS630 transposase-related protein [Pseudomonadota bacterium]